MPNDEVVIPFRSNAKNEGEVDDVWVVYCPCQPDESAIDFNIVELAGVNHIVCTKCREALGKYVAVDTSENL